MQIGNEDVLHSAPECRDALVRPATPGGLIAPTAWERKRLVAHADCAQQVRVVDQVSGGSPRASLMKRSNNSSERIGSMEVMPST